MVFVCCFMWKLRRKLLSCQLFDKIKEKNEGCSKNLRDQSREMAFIFIFKYTPVKKAKKHMKHNQKFDITLFIPTSTSLPWIFYFVEIIIFFLVVFLFSYCHAVLPSPFSLFFGIDISFKIKQWMHVHLSMSSFWIKSFFLSIFIWMWISGVLRSN